MSRPVVDLLRMEWEALAELGDSLGDDEWEMSTDCPGWSVRDNFSHIIGTERQLLGESAPEPPAGEATPEWVKNPIGELNERWVAARRSVPGPEVLEEFREVTRRRLEHFETMTDDDWAEPTPGPTGMVPYEEFMDIRVMDAWVHEQDIRRAIGRPGHQSGPVVEASLGRFVPAMGFVVGKKAGAEDGQSVLFDLSGAQPMQIGVTVRDGRATADLQRPENPTVTLAMDVETWWCLALGRRSGEDVRAADDVEISGDTGLGERVLDGMAFMI